MLSKGQQIGLDQQTYPTFMFNWPVIKIIEIEGVQTVNSRKLSGIVSEQTLITSALIV